MLLAMTPPLLAVPLQRVWRSSLSRRRAAAIFVFLLGYGTVWVLAGPLFLLTTIAMHSLLGAGAAISGGALIVAWQSSWLKRRCLTLCHQAPSLRLFGLGAWQDVARYGVWIGFWCLGSCGPLMIAPTLLSRFHLWTMLAVAALVTIERHFSNRRPRWRRPSHLELAHGLGWHVRQHAYMR